MDEKTEEKMFTVYEWTIENFTRWKSDHKFTKMVTEPRPDMVQFELIRQYVGPGNEILSVNIGNVNGRAKGDFSLICPGADWTIHVDKDEDYDYEFIGVLPFNFGKLVSLIEKNKASEMDRDRLTLRFCYENEEGNVFHYIHSKVEDMTMSMKISLSSILNGQPEGIESRVITAEYPLNDRNTEKVKVRINETLSKIELMLEPCSSKEAFFRTSMSVLHKDGSVIRTEEREAEIPEGETWTFSDSLTRNEVVQEGLSILLKLTVFPYCKLINLYTLSTPSVGEVAATTTESASPTDHTVGVLQKDFSSLLQNADFSDLQLVCEGVTFPAHKSILSARSPVFRSMLRSDMKEAGSGSVDIADLDPPTLAHFLAFLYSGSVEGLQSDAALKLYYAADKYMVPTLKTFCANVLCDGLSAENLSDVLRLAEQHRDHRLLSAVHSFVPKDYNEMSEIDELD